MTSSLKAFIWCVAVFVCGALSDLLAKFFVLIKSETSTMHYDMMAPEILGGYILCITGAVIIDIVFFYKKLSLASDGLCVAAFTSSLIPVALCKCHADVLNQFNPFYIQWIIFIALAVSFAITWLSKMHLYEAEKMQQIQAS